MKTGHMIEVVSLCPAELAHIRKAVRECDLVDLAVIRASVACGRMRLDNGKTITFSDRMRQLDLNLHILGVK